MVCNMLVNHSSVFTCFIYSPSIQKISSDSTKATLWCDRFITNITNGIANHRARNEWFHVLPVLRNNFLVAGASCMSDELTITMRYLVDIHGEQRNGKFIVVDKSAPLMLMMNVLLVISRDGLRRHPVLSRSNYTSSSCYINVNKTILIIRYAEASYKNLSVMTIYDVNIFEKSFCIFNSLYALLLYLLLIHLFCVVSFLMWSILLCTARKGHHWEGHYFMWLQQGRGIIERGIISCDYSKEGASLRGALFHVTTARKGHHWEGHYFMWLQQGRGIIERDIISCDYSKEGAALRGALFHVTTARKGHHWEGHYFMWLQQGRGIIERGIIVSPVRSTYGGYYGLVVVTPPPPRPPRPPRPQTLHRSHDNLKNPYRIASIFYM